MGTDYDTYLQAWKMPPKVDPVTPPPIVVPDPPITVVNPVKPVTVKKTTVEPFNIDYYSSTLKSDAKTAVRIDHGDTTIGHVQRGLEGSWETTRTGIRTRFIIDKRGWVALDKDGLVLKDGTFKKLFDTQDDAIDFLKRNADLKPEPPVTLPTPAPTPAPIDTPLTYDTARQQFKQVKKEFPKFTEAQARREAAKRMNVDYDTYLKAWKGDKGVPKPAPSPVDVPTTPRPVQESGIKAEEGTVRDYLKSRGNDEDDFIVVDFAGDGVRVVMRPGTTRFQAIKIKRELEDAGFQVEQVGGQTFRWRVTNPKRKILNADEEPAWKPKGNSKSAQVTDEDGRVYVGDQHVATIYYKDGFWRVRPTFGNESKFNPYIIYSDPDAALAAARADAQYMVAPSDLKAVNPGYRRVVGTTQNCPACTSGYELRRRGFDVVARKMPAGQVNMDIWRAWGITPEYQIGSEARAALGSDFSARSTWPFSTTHEEFLAEVAKMPDGARGFLTVEWEKGGAHIFNWEMRDGELWFIDSQPGTEAPWKDMRYFSRAKPMIWAARTDQLPIDPDLLRWFVSDNGKQIEISGAPKWVQNVPGHQKDQSLS